MLPNASAAGATQVPVAETGRVMPLIVSSPSTLAVPSSAMSMSCEVKVDLGVVGGVEELAAEDVGAELLGRADRDRLDLRGALEAAVDELGVDLVERALEERDALVADGEAEARVDGIGDVGAGQLGGGGHWCFPRWWFRVWSNRRAFRLCSTRVAPSIADATTRRRSSPRDPQAVGEHVAHRGRGGQHAAAGGRQLVEREAQRALAEQHRGGGVARVALLRDARDVAAARARARRGSRSRRSPCAAPSRSGPRRGRGGRGRAACASGRSSSRPRRRRGRRRSRPPSPGASRPRPALMTSR